jgi:hypothetical protein
MYLDLVYQWRQLADEFKALEKAKGNETGALSDAQSNPRLR